MVQDVLALGFPPVHAAHRSVPTSRSPPNLGFCCLNGSVEFPPVVGVEPPVAELLGAVEPVGFIVALPPEAVVPVGFAAGGLVVPSSDLGLTVTLGYSLVVLHHSRSLQIFLTWSMSQQPEPAQLRSKWESLIPK